MNNLIKFILCCAVALTHFSCTSVLNIRTSLPPAVTVTHDQWKVVAVDRFNPSLLAYSNREKKTAAVAYSATEAFFGATEAIMQDHTFILVATDTTAKYKQREPGQKLTQEEIKDIYQKHPHHLVLALEHVDTFFEQETVREKDEDGDVSKTAHYTLHVRTRWTLYDSTGTVVDHATLRASDYYKSRTVLSGLLAIGPSVANAGPLLNKLAWQTGTNYWQRLQPKQLSISRQYYSSRAFEQAARHIASRNWQQAAALLQPLTESTHKKTAGRAAYNLAIVHEAQGKMEEARKWAKVAAEKGNNLGRELQYAVNYNESVYPNSLKLTSEK